MKVTKIDYWPNVNHYSVIIEYDHLYQLFSDDEEKTWNFYNKTINGYELCFTSYEKAYEQLLKHYGSP